MYQSFLTAMLLLAAVISSAPVVRAQSAPAQAQSTPAKPDPSDVTASVPPVRYDSSFAGYRAFADEDVAPWKETNDTAGRIGGWRVYARGAREPESGKPTAPSPATKPAPAGAAKPMQGGHDGHNMK